MRFADAPAVENDAVTGLVVGVAAGLDRAGDINTRHHRELADNRPFAGNRQPVLVVERRIIDTHRDVAFRQLAFINLLHRGTVTGVVLFDQNSLEH